MALSVSPGKIAHDELGIRIRPLETSAAELPPSRLTHEFNHDLAADALLKVNEDRTFEGLGVVRPWLPARHAAPGVQRRVWTALRVAAPRPIPSSEERCAAYRSRADRTQGADSGQHGLASPSGRRGMSRIEETFRALMS